MLRERGQLNRRGLRISGFATKKGVLGVEKSHDFVFEGTGVHELGLSLIDAWGSCMPLSIYVLPRTAYQHIYRPGGTNYELGTTALLRKE